MESSGEGGCVGPKGHQDVPLAQQVAGIALVQGGHVSNVQLQRLGLSPRAIKHQVVRSRLIRVHHGVYAVGHLPTNPIDRAKGVVLAGGPRAALGFGSAAAFWSAERVWRHPFELISATDRRLAGVRVHQCKTLLRRDIRVVDGLRVTSPARTLLDIAPRLTGKQLTRAVEDLRHARKVTLGQLRDVVQRNPRHAGAPLLRPLIEAAQQEPTRSELEDRFLRLVARHHLPTPQVNVYVAGYRVDAYFPDHDLIVELDGWLTHQTRQAFSRDRRQDAEILAKTGIPTVRLTYEQTTHHRSRTAGELKAILAARAHAADNAQPNRQQQQW
jgi:very-short-patch-repair endonuclease